MSALGGNLLPVKEGENSTLVYFRIYNNWNGSGSVATMNNVRITVFDDADSNSHTAAKSPVSQSWVRIFETGFGEGSTTPALLTQFIGEDTPIGRSGVDSYLPEYGSNGQPIPSLRAGTDGNGVGFIEFATYVEAPDMIGFGNYTLALSLDYQWST